MRLGKASQTVLVSRTLFLKPWFCGTRENLAQIIQAGQRVIDNPVYISDLGETLAVTASLSATLQASLSCTLPPKAAIIFCFASERLLFGFVHLSADVVPKVSYCQYPP